MCAHTQTFTFTLVYSPALTHARNRTHTYPHVHAQSQTIAHAYVLSANSCKCMKTCGSIVFTDVRVDGCDYFGNDNGRLFCDVQRDEEGEGHDVEEVCV